MILAIHFRDPDIQGFPYNHSGYFKSYLDFSRLCQKKGIKVYLVRGNSYLGKMVFKEGSRFFRGKIMPVKHKIKTDIIYEKGYFQLKISPDDLVVNPVGLANICRDKLKTYQLFPEFMVKHWLINQGNYQRVLKKIPTRKVVLKPITGYGGEGIIIVDKKKFQPQLLPLHQRYLAQRFIDTSQGIPGVIKGWHDLRVIIFNGQAKIAYIRQPKKDSLLANYDQGGTIKIIKLNQVPSSALTIVRQIDKKLSSFFPRIYSIDFGFEKGIPYVFELNSQPGMPFREDEKFYRHYSRFHRYLLETILSARPLIKS